MFQNHTTVHIRKNEVIDGAKGMSSGRLLRTLYELPQGAGFGVYDAVKLPWASYPRQLWSMRSGSALVLPTVEILSSVS